MTVVFPVAITRALDARALCQLTLIVVGMIAIVINVLTPLVAIVVRVASGAM